jgi:putative ATPase
LTFKQPLADLIRPQKLEEFIGQSHIQQRILALLNSKRPSSLLLFGPPGCGKSTLALLLAQSFQLPYIRLSAPEVGLSNLRKKIQDIDVLILDELHRFSKAQQDFFLPLLESGKIILLGTTTENPSFSVTNQLLSRLHVLRLKALSTEELLQVAERGKTVLEMEISAESLRMTASLSGGDARNLLNLLEYIREIPAEKRDPESLRSALPEVITRGARDADSHYELASALIKSIRGSDPDAALYYLAGMLESGEDPRFICRRLILAASEDIGLADPQALSLAVSCQQAVEFVGMPEGFIPLAETVTYLALTAKSNSAYAGYLAAQKEIRKNGLQAVPLHLRNPSTSLHKKWGYGQGYKYPHAYPEAWVEQQYLPDNLNNTSFYQPKEQGLEQKLSIWLRKLRKSKK